MVGQSACAAEQQSRRARTDGRGEPGGWTREGGGGRGTPASDKRRRGGERTGEGGDGDAKEGKRGAGDTTDEGGKGEERIAQFHVIRGLRLAVFRFFLSLAAAAVTQYFERQQAGETRERRGDVCAPRAKRRCPQGACFRTPCSRFLLSLPHAICGHLCRRRRRTLFLPFLSSCSPRLALTTPTGGCWHLTALIAYNY